MTGGLRAPASEQVSYPFQFDLHVLDRAFWEVRRSVRLQGELSSPASPVASWAEREWHESVARARERC